MGILILAVDLDDVEFLTLS